MSRGSFSGLEGQVLASKDNQHTHGFCLAPSRATPGYGVSQSKQHKGRPDRPQRDPGSQSQAELLLNSDPKAAPLGLQVLFFLSINRGRTLLFHIPPTPATVWPVLSPSSWLKKSLISPCPGVSVPPSLARKSRLRSLSAVSSRWRRGQIHSSKDRVVSWPKSTQWRVRLRLLGSTPSSIGEDYE